MMTLNKEILMHPDFMTDLANELCGMLEDIIDAEFDKDDDTDFDFIDECADAINAIRSGDDSQILPLISRKAFLDKIGIKAERKFKILVAAAAAIAILFTTGTQIEVEENISIVQALSGIVSDFFTDEKQAEETTTQPATTLTATEKEASLISISVEATPDFKTEYYVGERFSSNGLKVFGEYDNGEKRLVRIDDYTVEVSDSFGTEPKYETVKISVGSFTQTLEVRVIESIETKKLNSIYAVFPDDFTFTAKDLNNIDLSAMQVYAVYSNGDERELSADEYALDIEIEKHLFKKEAFVTVSYERCSCSFAISGEQKTIFQ
ncbi:MAG: bacterial Ig-like domain-containing protein [Clostridia bacterium]|nr:bacterial Ig-like domain-containing protein [Clostridia bacterium]